MKLSELLAPCRHSALVEGTWSLPDSHAAVMQVMKLLDSPIKATDKRKNKLIWKYLGSDALFDDLDQAKEDKVEDVRPIIIKHLPSFLDTRRWFQQPDEETQFAINMLKKKYDIR